MQDRTQEQRNYCERKLAYEIDSWDLKVAIEAGEKVTVVDARSRQAFGRGHIPGAVNIPHREMTVESTAAVDRDSLVVAYCDGIGCNASTKGALRMLDLGFRVRELIGGIDWWVRDGHPLDPCAAGTSEGCGCGGEDRRTVAGGGAL